MFQPEVRLQRAAVTLAEDMNFTRAADRLNITQSALSKQIADLEEDVGFEIFTRGQKRVELTGAGQVFIRGCLEAKAAMEKAIRLGRASHENARPHLSIGHSPYAEPWIMTSILSTHLPLFPDLRLRMESMFAQDLTQGVLSAELDLAIIADPPESPNLTLVKVSTRPLCVVMPIEHPAAQKASVSIEELGEVGWMIFPKRAHPALYERVLSAGRHAPVSPVELHHYVSPQDAVRLVVENFGVAFMAKGIADQIRDQGVVVRPLSVPAFQVNTHLVLRADQSSRIANEFGRAFLRRVIPRAIATETSGQLLLGL